VLFRANDADSLVEKVGALLESQQQWPALRQAGRDYVETERNWPVSVARYKNIYGRLTGTEAA
jgi:glycosyltransferase involved in cell wall biosynthesis